MIDDGLVPKTNLFGAGDVLDGVGDVEVAGGGEVETEFGVNNDGELPRVLCPPNNAARSKYRGIGDVVGVTRPAEGDAVLARVIESDELEKLSAP